MLSKGSSLEFSLECALICAYDVQQPGVPALPMASMLIRRSTGDSTKHSMPATPITQGMCTVNLTRLLFSSHKGCVTFVGPVAGQRLGHMLLQAIMFGTHCS